MSNCCSSPCVPAESYGRRIYINLSLLERAIRNLSDLIPSTYVEDFYRDYMLEYYRNRYHDFGEEKLFYMLSHNGSLNGYQDGKVYSLPDKKSSV